MFVLFLAMGRRRQKYFKFDTSAMLTLPDDREIYFANPSYRYFSREFV